jgi:uncharacterized membrane protein (DUF4010 family)
MDIGSLFTSENGLEYVPSFATSLAVGLLIGVERERSPAAKAGLRTFSLVALLGTMLAFLSDRSGSAWPLVAGLLAVGAMIIAAYVGDDQDRDPGTTTQAALMLCFGLGAVIWYGYSTLAVMLAILTTTMLHYKLELEGISRSLSRADVASMLQFAVLSLIILPILPNQDYGPYETLNPYQTWLMVVLISGISLAGYVALRMIGQRYGAPLLGFLGGLVSSTATTLVYARHGRNGAMLNLAVVVITIANLVVLVRLAALSALLAPGILPHILPALVMGFLFGAAVTFYWWRRMQRGGDLPVPEIKNPTEIKTALSFGALYAVVLLAAAWLSDVAGSRGLYLLALASGLTDVDAISLSSLRLFSQGKLVAEQAVLAITIAYLSNLAFKFGLLTFFGGRALARHAAPSMGAAALGVLVGAWLS